MKKKTYEASFRQKQTGLCVEIKSSLRQENP